MNRDLDKYINENRLEFDQVESFDMEETWMNIQLDKTSKNTRNDTHLSRFLWLFGSIFLFSCLLWAWNSYQKSPLKQEIANLPIDMIETHESLISRVNSSEKKLEEYEFQSSDFDEIMNEIKQLEEQKSIFLHDYNKTGNKEQYARILLKHYERKARIIELLLYEINKKENDEKINKI